MEGRFVTQVVFAKDDFAFALLVLSDGIGVWLAQDGRQRMRTCMSQVILNFKTKEFHVINNLKNFTIKESCGSWTGFCKKKNNNNMHDMAFGWLWQHVIDSTSIRHGSHLIEATVD